jgi:hypothetical protein
MAVKREFVSITFPTQSETLASTIVAVNGTCSPPSRTITAAILVGTSTSASRVVVANGTNWAAPGFQLSSKQNYTASAADGSASDSKDFSIS